MRIFGYLVLLALIAFVAWPYYEMFRLDDALGDNDMQALGQLVDLPAIRRNYKERLGKGLGLEPGRRDPNRALAWLQQNLQRLGDAALEKTITLEWVRDTLQDGTRHRQKTALFPGRRHIRLLRVLRQLHHSPGCARRERDPRPHAAEGQ